MTTNATNDDRTWHIEYAKRSLATMTEDATTEIRRKIDWIRRSLDEGAMPNTCGILQGSAAELEMALARLAAMRDALDAAAAPRKEAR